MSKKSSSTKCCLTPEAEKLTMCQRVTMITLRLSLGVLFFYAGITKVVDPTWSAAGYLKGAKTFSFLFQWMLDPAIMPFVNLMNEWGLTLLGVSLIIGTFVRASSYAGMMLMALYYLAILDFPYPNAHALLVDEHIIYIAALLVLISFNAGNVWGLDAWLTNRKK